MNAENTKKQSVIATLKELGFWVGAFLLTLTLFFAFKPLIACEEYAIRVGVVAQSLTVFTFCVILSLGAYWYFTGRLTAQRVFVMLLIAGYALRVGYML